MQIKQSSQVIITVEAVSSSPVHSISGYEYTLNNQVTLSQQNQFIIPAGTLPIGKNLLEIRVRDTCSENNWSAKQILELDVIGDPIIKDYPFEFDMNQPNVTLEITISIVGTANLTFKYEDGTPIQAAKVTIGSQEKTTDASGFVTMDNLVYGHKTGIISVA